MATPIKVGQVLFLQQSAIRVDEEEEAQLYKARVADIKENHIAIELPMSEKTGRVGIFMVGEEFDVWFFHPDGAKYFFESHLTGRKKERIPMVLLALPNEDQIIKTQRREYLRVPAEVDMAIHPLQQDAFEPFVVKTNDLSGGGTSFRDITNNVIKEGTPFKWWLALDLKQKEMLHPSGLGEVVRIFNQNDHPIPYFYPIKFTEVSTKNEQKIIRYCFYRQMELNNKGLTI